MTIHCDADVLTRLPDNTPERAKFPVIDAHNHLFGDASAEELMAAMDAVGVRTFLNLTGNATLPYENNCYTIQRRDISDYINGYVKRYCGRFAAFTMADFAQWGDPVLIKDEGKFVDICIQRLEEDVRLGALGLKVTKELGLFFRDYKGAMIAVDDERLFPIWRRAGELGIPVLIHTSDPWGFFLPVDEKNEHYQTLLEFPAWSFYNSCFSKQELLDQRDRMVALHSDTRFILPHVANNPENLLYVSSLLDRLSNVFIDFSARMDELGRRPFTARDFFTAYQDRIMFGVDMPVRPDIYRAYFRFLETRDEYFEYPDYIGRWGKSRWRIYALNLSDDVLKKVYSENIIRLIPNLESRAY